MSAFSDYVENEILKKLFSGASTWATPANIWISLHVSDPGETNANTGEISTQATPGNYARQQVACNATNWTITNNQVVNAVTIQWPTTGTVTWAYTVTHFAIWDAVTGGNKLFQGALATSKTVSSGDVFQFLANGIQITLN